MLDCQPLPQKRIAPHVVPILLIVVFALATALVGWNVGYEYRWTSDTTDTFYRIISTLPTDRAASDAGLLATLAKEFALVIHDQPTINWYQGLFDAYLRSFLLVFGDISLAYKTQIFPLSLVFGASAYALFYRLTGNRCLAVALAFAALMPMPLAWAGERSGIGPIWTFTRRYFLTAWLPLLAILYFRAMLDTRKSIGLAMMSVGLASNLHASGIILLGILVLTWLVTDGVTGKRLLKSTILISLGLLCSVASFASIWKAGLGAITQLMLAALSNTAIAGEMAILEKARLAAPEVAYLFYPPKMYAKLPPALVSVWLLATVAISFWPLAQSACKKKTPSLWLFIAASACLLFISFEQMWAMVLLACVLYSIAPPDKHARAFVVTAYLIICTFWVAVVGMLLFQLTYGLIDGFPLVFNQLRGIRFVGFWVFIWLAVLAAPLTTMPRPLKKQPRLLLWATGIALLVTIQNFYRGYFRGLENERLEQKIALLELADWARQSTPQDSVFLVGYSSFGTRAERRITHTDKQVRNAAIEWLPPKGLKGPEESQVLAKQFHATHLFLSPAVLSSEFNHCVRASNAIYAIVETSCLEATHRDGPAKR